MDDVTFAGDEKCAGQNYLLTGHCFLLDETCLWGICLDVRGMWLRIKVKVDCVSRRRKKKKGWEQQRETEKNMSNRTEGQKQRSNEPI